MATPVSKFAEAVKANGWPETLEVGLIGSCTNSSYEDISRAASIAKQATDKKLKVKSEYTVTPGSEMVRYTVARDGYLKTFEELVVLYWLMLWTLYRQWHVIMLTKRRKFHHDFFQP